MALTKIGGGVLRQPIDVGIITATSLNASGIVTAGTVQVGAATTIHTTGIDLGSGNVTSHNINSTGIITATSFVGPVTGNVTGNTSGTASNLTGSPSITVGNITASGNVSIAGTLTYEDVTNIDSVGIITAQSDISIADKIVHTGDTNTAIRFPANDTVTVETAGSEKLRITAAGLVGIGTDNPLGTLHVGTDSSDAIRFGNATFGYRLRANISSTDDFGFLIEDKDGNDLYKVVSASGTNSAVNTHAFYTAGVERLRITSTGRIQQKANNEDIDMDATASGQLQLDGNGYSAAFALNAQGLNIYNNSANRGIIFGTNETERLRVDSTGDVRFAGTNLTNNTNKNVNLTAPSYNTSEEDVNLVQVENESGMNQISFGGGTSGLNAATTLRFLTASAVNTTTGTERLRITSDGKIGIGENSPDGLLVIKGDSNGATNPSIRLKDGSDTREAWITNSAGDLILANGGNDNVPHCVLKMFDGNIMVFSTANTERLRITSDGQLQATGAADVRLTLGSSGTAGTNDSVHIRADSANLKFMSANGGNTIFEANGTETLRITSAGNLLIGHNGLISHPNMDDLQIGDASGNRGLTICSGTAAFGSVCFGDSADGSGNDRYEGYIEYYHNDNSLRLGTSHTEKVNITSAGDIRMGPSSFGAPKCKLDIIEDTTISYGVTTTGSIDFIGMMIRHQEYCEFSVRFPPHATQTSLLLRFSRSANAPSISVDYHSGGGYQVDHGFVGNAYISFYSSNGATLYTGTNHQAAYAGGGSPSWSHGNGTTDVLLKLSNIAYSNIAIAHFRINIPRGSINNITVDRTTP